ncbi:SDR family oxidoreductase [Vibrio neptunius]|uniref:SDR family oxidoreductase n=1 Tax=Vibrio neptunius TaxID=170651 RepID=UPI001C5CBF1A|nr:SDR family oxidoreductase [Vibrio neptunius]QXX08429.1 SDR family oxidoreductase [Vibrio neptunius]
MKVLILGGNGGIGHAICRNLVQHYPGMEVHATYRKHQPIKAAESIIWHQLDVTNEAQVESLAGEIESVDWIVNAVGVLHDECHGPEKNLKSFDPDFYIKNIMHNALPTMLIAKHFQRSLKQSQQPKFATISAKVGSISDNHLGGWYSYRSSKAALNMLLKTLSIEWGRTMPKACVLSLHPGTTDTALSKPFQTNVPEGKLFAPDRVAEDLVKIIAEATPDSSGRFLSYNGETLPW